MAEDLERKNRKEAGKVKESKKYEHISQVPHNGKKPTFYFIRACLTVGRDEALEFLRSKTYITIAQEAILRRFSVIEVTSISPQSYSLSNP